MEAVGAKVVIIGAGPSGSAAADRLLTSSFTDFIVVEARDRIGGRIYSLPVGNESLSVV
jgi:cation diffusion facilitator CzcD-associated flavoprotein CzcO